MARTTQATAFVFAAALTFAAGPSLAPPASAQEARSIEAGASVTATLEAGAEHRYEVSAEDGFFVFGEVDQIGVDVVVTVLDPEGEEVDDFDGTARGDDFFEFETESEGSYVLVIAADGDGAGDAASDGRGPDEAEDAGAGGDYILTLVRAEPVATDPAARVDQLLARFTGDDTPGAVVGVVRGGEVVFEKAYGMANLAYGIPHEVDTPTNIGSVTKQFTAMALLVLENDGELSLDDDIREYIPELPDFGETVTLKNILNHATGYREIYNFLGMAGYDGEDSLDRETAIDIVRRQPELQASPDTEFNYNNTGYILAATVVERVSDMSFPDFVEARVFEPLGMESSRVKYVQGELIPGASTGYVPDERGGWRQARDLGASAGAGGIYTTFRDMTRWMANYRDGTVGGQAAIESLTTENILQNGDSTGYGLGIGVAEVRGLEVFTHTGGDTAHRTFFAYFPEIDGGVFASSNAATFPTGLGTQVAQLFFEDAMEPDDEAVADEEEADPAEDPDPDAPDATEAGEGATMPVERMEAIAGSWIIEAPGLSVELVLEEGRLYADPTGQPRAELTPTSDSTVVHEGVGVSIVFYVEEDGSVDSATFTQGRSSPMRRVEARAMTAEELSAYEGRYFSKELEAWVEVRVEEGDDPGEASDAGEAASVGESDSAAHLVLDRLRGDPIALSHVEGERFGGAFPFAEIEFVRASNGSVTGLLAGNGRTKEVLFELW